jgi:hypothetical protein
MIGIGIGVDRRPPSSGGASFDADYQAVLNYATTQGYTLPSAGQQTLQNQLVIDLKSAGVWSKLDTFAVFATDGNSDFALIDWKRLTQYTAFNSPTFTTNQGFTGNGTSSYVSTNYNPLGLGNYLLDNASRYTYIRTLIANKIIDGLDASTANSTTTFVSAFQRINQSGTSLSSSFDYGSSGAGMKSIHRTSSTGFSAFNQVILRSAGSYSGHQISMYAMGASLISENTAFVNAFNTYMTSI